MYPKGTREARPALESAVEPPLAEATSKIVTRAPWSAASIAAQPPAPPKPTTATSVSVCHVSTSASRRGWVGLILLMIPVTPRAWIVAGRGT